VRLVLDKKDVGQRVSGTYSGQEVSSPALAAVGHAMVEIVALGDSPLFELPVDLISFRERRRIFHNIAQIDFRFVCSIAPPATHHRGRREAVTPSRSAGVDTILADGR
jgi:hypothetical protein